MSKEDASRRGSRQARGQDAEAQRTIAAAFGARLQSVRRERGWKQDAFADALGVSRTTASNIERGHQRIFLDQVYRAGSILGVPIDALLPPAEVVGRDLVVHAAADDPLSRIAVRTLAETVAEVRQTLQKRAAHRFGGGR